VAEAAPEPVAEVAEEAAPAALPPFSLRIEVDPAAGKATVALDDDSEEIGLTHSDGRWRLDR